LLAAIIALFLLAFGSRPVVAAFADAGSSHGAVTSAIDDAIAILHNARMPVEQRRRELRAVAQQNLDLAKMAEGVLGTHWVEVTPAQQQEFVPLFEAFIEAA
jgi:ABC-type transporter MlaC component